MKRILTIALIVLCGVRASYPQTDPKRFLARKPLVVDDANAKNESAKLSNQPLFVSTGATTYTLGPGDSIGYTYYDYGTNGTANHNIINYGDGTISIGRMASFTKWSEGSSPDRGTYYTHFNGTSWSSFSRIEATRTGWGNIDQLVDLAGKEVVVSHLGPLMNLHSSKGTGTWAQTNPSGFLGTEWPKIAAGSSSTVHYILANTVPNSLYYYRSTDAGSTFDIVDKQLFVGALMTADGYDIAATGSSVAVAYVYPNQDVKLAWSTDNGTTWSEQVIYHSKTASELGYDDMQAQPDGSCSVLFDHDGNVHVVWGNYLAYVGNIDVGNMYYARHLYNPIYHWSATTGVTQVSLPAQDNALINSIYFNNMPGVDGALITSPDLGVDNSNNLYVTYQGQTTELNSNSLPFCHIFGTVSHDAGLIWSSPVDLTPVTGADNSFPSLARNVDANLHLVYNTDPFPGNTVQGNHPDTAITIKYLKFPVSSFGSVAPTAYTNNSIGVDQSHVKLRSYILPNGLSASLQYEWGLTSAYANATAAKDIGSGSTTISDTTILAGLTPLVTYHYRAAVTYAGGTIYGADQTFHLSNRWTAVNSGLTNTLVQALAVSATNLFAGTYGGGVFLSTDNGTSWTGVNTGLTDTIINAFAVSGPNLFVGTKNAGVFLSTNNGTSWSAVNTGLTYPEVNAFAVSDTNLFAGTWPGSVFLSTNNGTSWTSVSTGLTAYSISSLALSGVNLFAGSMYDGIFLSTNNGTNWNAVNTGVTDGYIRTLGVSGTTLFAGSDFVSGVGGVFRSTNNGTTWTAVNNGLTNPFIHAFAVSGTNIFAGTDGGVFFSADSGASWITVNTGFLTGTQQSLTYAFAVLGTSLFAGIYGHGVYQSALPAVLPVELTSLIASVGKSTVKLQWKTATEINNYGFEIERNANKPWTKIGFVPGNGTSNSPKAYSFTDENISAGKYLYRLKQIDRDGQFKYSQSVEVNVSTKPMWFALDQNYPNPMNPSTTINYAIPTRSHVTLSVFNTLGQKVAELVDGEKDAGSYDVTFEASGFASGVYLYRIQAGSFAQTRKLVVLR